VEGNLVEKFDVMRTSFENEVSSGNKMQGKFCSSSHIICAKLRGLERGVSRFKLTCGSISNRCLKI
jgi:hypothetical protein